MKKMISKLTFVALVVATIGIADTVSAFAEPANVMVELYGRGGLMAGFYKLQILSDGQVISSSQRLNDPVVSYEIARLSARSVQNLKKKVEALPKVELQDKNPDAPKCLDAGIATYSVNNANGNVAIAQSEYCHEFVRVDALGDDIKRIVDGLNSLEY